LFGQHWERLRQVIKQVDISVAILLVLAAVLLWWKSRHTS